MFIFTKSQAATIAMDAKTSMDSTHSRSRKESNKEEKEIKEEIKEKEKAKAKANEMGKEEDIENDKKTEKDGTVVLIFENAIKTSVDLVIENISWATAGILSLACRFSILAGEDTQTDVYEAWIYTIILLVIAFIYGTYPQTLLVDNYETIGRNLIVLMEARNRSKTKEIMADRMQMRQAIKYQSKMNKLQNDNKNNKNNRDIAASSDQYIGINRNRNDSDCHDDSNNTTHATTTKKDDKKKKGKKACKEAAPKPPLYRGETFLNIDDFIKFTDNEDLTVANRKEVAKHVESLLSSSNHHHTPQRKPQSTTGQSRNSTNSITTMEELAKRFAEYQRAQLGSQVDTPPSRSVDSSMLNTGNDDGRDGMILPLDNDMGLDEIDEYDTTGNKNNSNNNNYNNKKKQNRNNDEMSDIYASQPQTTQRTNRSEVSSLSWNDKIMGMEKHQGHVSKMINKFANSTFVEVNILFKNTSALAVATLANVIAQSLDLTIRLTINELIFHSGSVKYVITYGIAFLIESFFTTLVTLKLTQKLIHKENSVYRHVCARGIEHCQKRLINYRSLQRMVKLVCYIFSMALAWSVRNLIKYSIYTLLAGNTDPTKVGIGIIWIYVLFVQFCVTIVNIVNRKVNSLKKSMLFNFNQIKQRSYKNPHFLLYCVFYKQLQMVVGIAWSDGIFNSMVAISQLFSDNSNTQLNICTVLLWIACFIFIFLSCVCQFYWKKYWFNSKIERKGLLKAYYETVDNITSELTPSPSPSGNQNNNNQNNDNDNDNDNNMVNMVTIGNDIDDTTNNNVDTVTNVNNGGSGSNSENEAILTPTKRDFDNNGKDTMEIRLLTDRNKENKNGSDEDLYEARRRQTIYNKRPLLKKQSSIWVLTKEQEFSYVALKESIDLLLYAWAIGGSFTVCKALTYTFIQLFYNGNETIQRHNLSNTVNTAVIVSIWIAWIVSLLISVFVLTYLSSIVEKASTERRKLFRKIKKKKHHFPN